ncbi:unnamed protein product [Brassica oleracea var. botrytis]
MCEKIVIKEEKELAAMTGTGKCLSSIPSESKWKEGNKLIFPINRGWHVIDNVVYCSNSDGLVMWCEAHKWESPETEVVAWREVMGLEALRDTLAASKLVSYAGRLILVWHILMLSNCNCFCIAGDLPVVIYHVPVADAMYDLITAVSVVCSFYNSFTNPSALSLEFICVR